MTVVGTVALMMGFATAAGCLVLLVRRGPLADRAIALDTLTTTVVAATGAGIVMTGDGEWADVALVLGLLGFLGTVAVARFMERERRRP